jgi:hypothetical protein
MFRHLGVKKARVAKANIQAFYRGFVPAEGLAGIVVERREAIDIISTPNPPRGQFLELDRVPHLHYSDRERYVKKMGMVCQF